MQPDQSAWVLVQPMRPVVLDTPQRHARLARVALVRGRTVLGLGVVTDVASPDMALAAASHVRQQMGAKAARRRARKLKRGMEHAQRQRRSKPGKRAE